MNLLVLMYHRAMGGPDGNSQEMLDAHFAHIARHYPCTLPGQRLREGRLNVCLSFDDGYFDFYQNVMPLLKKHGLSALLAISPGLCPERCDENESVRLNLPDGQDYPHRTPAGFCSWPELQEIARSGWVRFAAHGFTHAALDDDCHDVEAEIIQPKRLLEQRLGTSVQSFVFPFGRYSPRAFQLVRQHYRYAFRIGHASNSNWTAPMLYRVGADRMQSPDQLFSSPRRCRYFMRNLWNRARRR